MLNVECRPAARTTSPQRNGRTHTRNERPGLRSHIMALKSILAISSADSREPRGIVLLPSSRPQPIPQQHDIARPQDHLARLSEIGSPFWAEEFTIPEMPRGILQHGRLSHQCPWGLSPPSVLARVNGWSFTVERGWGSSPQLRTHSLALQEQWGGERASN